MGAKKKVLFVVAVVVIVAVVFVFVLRESSKSYAGGEAYSVVQTSDGGYAIAGYTVYGIAESTVYGRFDFWLVKTDASGNMEWSKTYGTMGDDRAYSVIQTNDGGYAIAGGGTDSLGAFLLVKTDSTGNIQWNKTYEGTGSYGAHSLIQIGDGGYAIAGSTGFNGGDFYLIETDVEGNIQWNKTYGWGGLDLAMSMVHTRDGGYALTGVAGGDAFWLVKTDADGDMQWSQGYKAGETSGAFSVAQASDGGYALVGNALYPRLPLNESLPSNPFTAPSIGPNPLDSLWFVKTDALGNPQWNITYRGKNGPSSVIRTSDGGLAVLGIAGLFVKTDVNGNTQWNSTLGGRSVIQTIDGGYAIAGSTNVSLGQKGFSLVKTDSTGNIQWSKTYGRQVYTWTIPWLPSAIAYIAGNFTKLPRLKKHITMNGADISPHVKLFMELGVGSSEPALAKG